MMSEPLMSNEFWIARGFGMGSSISSGALARADADPVWAARMLTMPLWYRHKQYVLDPVAMEGLIRHEMGAL